MAVAKEAEKQRKIIAEVRQSLHSIPGASPAASEHY